MGHLRRSSRRCQQQITTTVPTTPPPTSLQLRTDVLTPNQTQFILYADPDYDSDIDEGNRYLDPDFEVEANDELPESSTPPLLPNPRYPHDHLSITCQVANLRLAQLPPPSPPPAHMADPPNHPRHASLKAAHPHIGSVQLLSVNDERLTPNLLDLYDPGMKSMLRLIDFCDNSTHNTRGFLDNFMKMTAEETQQNGFDPHTAPNSETTRRKMKELYGKGLQPSAVPIRLKVTSDPTHETNPDLVSTGVRDIVNCFTFDLEAGIIDLLSDREIFGNLANLVVNTDGDPFLPYKNEDKACKEEFLDGSWYSDTIDRMKKSDKGFFPLLEFLLPIIVYLDKTGTSDNQRYPLEPVIFTLGIIRRQLRNSTRSWRPAGLIPDLEAKSSAYKEFIRSRGNGVSSHNYHLCLRAVLTDSFQKIQDKGIVTWLRLGDHVKLVRLRPQLMCIMNDGKSADAICSQKGAQKSAACISRGCYTPYHLASSVTHKCQHVTGSSPLPTDQEECDEESVAPSLESDEESDPTGETDIESDSEGDEELHSECNPDDLLECLFDLAASPAQRIVDKQKPRDQPRDHQEAQKMLAAAAQKINSAKERLWEAGFQPSMNAFLYSQIEFGLDPRGVWGANPTDLMHAFQSGIVMYIVKMTIDPLTTRLKMELDNLVDRLFGHLRSSEKGEYPRLNFSKGFSKLSNLTSDEWPGKLFVLLIAARDPEGQKIFSTIFSDKDLPLKFTDDVAVMEQAARYQASSRTLDKEARELIAGQPRPAKPTKTKTRQGDGTRLEFALRKCGYNDFLHLAEAMLCFHSWYKRGPHTDLDKEGLENLHQSMCRLIAMIKYYMPRKAGNGWNLQKLHDLMHLAENMGRFASCRNFDCGPLESALRYWAKLPAATSQMRGYYLFSEQVGNRWYEFQYLGKARRENGITGVRDQYLHTFQPQLDPAAPPTHAPAAQVCGSSCTVHATPLPRTENVPTEEFYRPYPPCKWSGSDTRRKGHVMPNSAVLSYLRKYQYLDRRKNNNAPLLQPSTRTNGLKTWLLHTEAKLHLLPDSESPNKEETTIRCHPNYQNAGPFYDWVIIKYEMDPAERRRKQSAIKHTTQYKPDCVPAKVLAFAEDPETGGIVAIVHPCDFRKPHLANSNDSVITEQWFPHYTKIPKENTKNSTRAPRTLDEPRSPGNAFLDKPHYRPALSIIQLDCILCKCLVVGQKLATLEILVEKGTKRDASGALLPTGTFEDVLLVQKYRLWGNNFT